MIVKAGASRRYSAFLTQLQDYGELLLCDFSNRSLCGPALLDRFDNPDFLFQ